MQLMRNSDLALIHHYVKERRPPKPCFVFLHIDFHICFHLNQFFMCYFLPESLFFSLHFHRAAHWRATVKKKCRLKKETNEFLCWYICFEAHLRKLHVSLPLRVGLAQSNSWAGHMASNAWALACGTASVQTAVWQEQGKHHRKLLY